MGERVEDQRTLEDLRRALYEQRQDNERNLEVIAQLSERLGRTTRAMKEVLAATPEALQRECDRMANELRYAKERADICARDLRKRNQELDKARKQNAELRAQLSACVPDFVFHPRGPGE